jgi:acyl-CoA thioester hydrolase
MYEKTFFAGWGDMDFNAHMRNTAYLDKCGDVRMMFFAEHGFPMSEFMRLRLGPVILKDELEYFKEVNLLDPLRVTLAVGGMAPDGSRLELRNEFFRGDGKRAARVISYAGWLDLEARRLVVPPPDLLAALQFLQRTADFAELDGLGRR